MKRNFAQNSEATDEIIEDSLPEDFNLSEDESAIAEKDDSTVIEEEASNEAESESKKSVDDSDGENDLVVSIGDEKPEETEETRRAPEWVRELRKSHREAQKENRELKAKLEELSSPELKSMDPGKKPTLEGCDYDSSAYEKSLSEWYEKKREHDASLAEQRAEREREEKEWKSTLDSYGVKKSELKAKDFDEVEMTVQDALSVTQQGMIVSGADNPALVVYALGKNPEKLKELASITNPVKFAFAVAKLETVLKVNRKSTPPPEKSINGTGRVASTTEQTLERLRAEARKTGDFSKVTAYKRKIQSKG